MSVELDPVELGFRRPFTREVTETLRLRNPGTDPVAFKVKTTAPKQYCVRPNAGRIEGGEMVEVQVILQAMKEEPPLEARCRDKFLVQTVAIVADQEVNSAAAVWSNIEQTAKSSIQEKKIRVNFLPSQDSAATGAAATPIRTSHAHNESLPAYSSPASSTPQQYSSGSVVGASSTPGSRFESSKSYGDVKSSSYNSHTDSQQSTLGAIASAIPTSAEELKAQLAEAQATISRLTTQAQDSVLRSRKTDGGVQERSSTSTSYGTQQATPSGVPVPIVAALCLLSFLLAYLLF